MEKYVNDINVLIGAPELFPKSHTIVRGCGHFRWMNNVPMHVLCVYMCPRARRHTRTNTLTYTSRLKEEIKLNAFDDKN